MINPDTCGQRAEIALDDEDIFVENEEGGEYVEKSERVSRVPLEDRCRISSRTFLCGDRFPYYFKKFLLFLPAFLGVKAFWLSLVTLGICDLATVESLEGDEASGESVTVEHKFGLWSYTSPTSPDSNAWIIGEALRECVFPLDQRIFIVDHKFHAARACGVIAVLIGAIATMVLWAVSGFDYRIGKKAWRLIGCSLVVGCLFEGLVLLIFRASVCHDLNPYDVDEEDVKCNIAEGGTTIITSCVFWLLTGLAMLLSPPSASSMTPIPDSFEFQNGESEENVFEFQMGSPVISLPEIT